MTDRFLKYYWHPFLIGLFPVLFLFANNIFYIPATEILTPLAIVILFTVAGLALALLIYRNLIKSAIWVSFGWILFFHFSALFNGVKKLHFTPLHHYLAFFLFISALFLTGSILIYRYKKNLHQFNKVLNVFAFILLIVPVSQIFIFYAQNSNFKPGTTPQETTAWKTSVAPENLPDIVYLVLDGYGRQDILKKYYNMDNRPFITALEQEGFFVAPRSTSNYCRTIVSVASSLNLNYIQNILPANPNCQLTITELAEDATLFKFLKNYDYNLYSFVSGYMHTELNWRTRLLSKKQFMPHSYSHILQLTPFSILEENAFLYDKFQKVQARLFNFDIKNNQNCQSHRESILFALEESPKYIGQAKPSFIFADILVSHPPFVFDQDGGINSKTKSCTLADGNDAGNYDPANRAQYIEGCRKQLTFLNKKIKETVQQIKKNSTRPTVIILQGDHGPGAYFHQESVEKTNIEERFSILNAIYFSDTTAVLPAGLTPVNNFRYVLNYYFGTTLPILQNHNYFSPGSAPCRFTEVTDRLNP